MILLDTHVLVRYANGERKLGRLARAAIDHALDRDDVFVSALSFWEIAMLIEKRRLSLETTVAGFRSTALRHGIQEVVVDGDVAITAGELPPTHGDPVDRMLVATAIVRGAALMTADEVLLGWKLRGYRARDATA